MTVDVVCPLYRAEPYIDRLLAGITEQKGIQIAHVVFPLTDEGKDLSVVMSKIKQAGHSSFLVPKDEFSHSTAREKAIMEYCTAERVIMLSQDVVIIETDAFLRLAAAVTDKVIYAYGRQTAKQKSIEYYVRRANYGEKSIQVGAEDVEKLQLRAFFASDAFACYDRPAFLALGGYDGVRMMMNEDMYYAKKAIDAGYQKAYVSDAVVEHSHKFTLRQLYRRYYETGIWFANHQEFSAYKATDSGLKLALSVFKQALKHFNIPVLVCFFPDMMARYFGMKKGKKTPPNKQMLKNDGILEL